MITGGATRIGAACAKLFAENGFDIALSLNTLILGLARSLAPEIHMNAVCPGFVDTQWLERHLPADAFAAFRSRVSSQAPLDLVVTPDDVARTVFWLAAEAKSATGVLFVLDAGVHLNISQPV
jgi:3-oxoacyl-[acyl-carrier protein] reductase